jgi:hypothetical protein
MPETTQVIDLLGVAPAQRDLSWLKAALQTAARLEFSTIPPYLCAMWSIKDTDSAVYQSFREVVMEEMRHLGLVNNMMTTIGETPKLFPDAAPAYPCKLPGGVRPHLDVPLRRLTRQGVKDIFMEIEKPHHDISGLDPTDETDPTIGDFYDAILGAFEALPRDTVTGKTIAISGQRQLFKNINIRPGVVAVQFKVESLDDVRKAIHTIKEQGEGTGTSPIDTAKGIAMDLAHYFRFAEIHQGKALAFDDEGKIVFTGPPIEWQDTDVYSMADIPPGGYKASDVPAGVAETLAEFDQTYTNMLKLLQEAWEPSPADPTTAQPAKLSAAVGAMFHLTEIALALMGKEIAPGGPTFGPCFRISEQG